MMFDPEKAVKHARRYAFLVEHEKSINALYQKMMDAGTNFADACVRLHKEDTATTKAELLRLIEELDQTCAKHHEHMTTLPPADSPETLK